MTDSISDQKYVLVTGCSSGIGRACAIELAKQGWSVLAGVRKPEDCHSLLAEQATNLTPIILDIADEESVNAAYHVVEEATNPRGLTALVNNAGALVPGPLELLTHDQMRYQFEVNVFGSHRLTQRMLPLLRLASSRRSPSRLVFISSISGRITPPYFGAYAASKHALESMAEAWRNELLPWHISVSVVQPDSVATPIWDKACGAIESSRKSNVVETYDAIMRTTLRKSLTYKSGGLSPRVVVNSILHSLNHPRPRPYYPVGWRTRAAFIAHSLLPTTWMDFILRRSIGG